MNARDVRAFTIIAIALFLNWRISEWHARTGHGFALLVLTAAAALALVLLWGRRKLREEQHGSVRRSRSRHPSRSRRDVPPAFTASNGCTVYLVEQDPGFPPVLQVHEHGILRFTTLTPNVHQVDSLQRLYAQAVLAGDALHPKAITALVEYLQAVDTRQERSA